jgi:hypothetical protein
MDIHLERGMHCVDCHFVQDAHGNGKLYGEVRAAIEIQCIDCHGRQDVHGGEDGKIYSQMRDPIAIRCWDCHGTPSKAATLVTSGLSKPVDMSKEQNTWGKPWMERKGGKVIQNSKMEEGMSWEVKQVVDVINPTSANYNPRASKAMSLREHPVLLMKRRVSISLNRFMISIAVCAVSRCR